MSVQDSAAASILEGLRSSHPKEVWAEFLLEYSPLIFETCQYSTADADQAADCYLFACEQLSRNSFRRLIGFRGDGRASFCTWLRVVVRNLCLDWRRKEFGRSRLFRSIARLSQLAAAVYRCYEDGLSGDQTFVSLRANFPGLTVEQLAAAEVQVQESLNSRQRWLMSTHRAPLRTWKQKSSIDVIEAPVDEPVDPRPSQESAIAEQEQQDQLRLAVGKLPKSERLLIRLRFEQGLSLEEVAGLTGLGDAQRVHRRIAGILEKLRTELT
jgi:RNA polymerase sigma factor (sigma-70 family)